MMSKLRVVHYINQFFAGLGGEEKADVKPEIREGKVGPGAALAAALGQDAEIVATVVCGDSYYNENLEVARKTILDMVKQQKADLFIAGPAFNAGRYGVACGDICKAVSQELGIPVVTGMYIENPGVDLYRRDVSIIKTGGSAADMRNAVPVMAKAALKLARGEELKAPEDGVLEKGIRKNMFRDERGSKRAVDMLIAKLNGQPFETEYPMPDFDRVTPNPAVKDISKAKIALVTSGGIVPKGNPDSIEASSATKYGKYDIEGVNDLTSDKYQTAHGGYDPVYANEDPDRVLPVDVLRDLEKEGVIGQLHRYFYSTVGNGTSVANAKGFASEFAKELKADGVDAVILTST
jgi:betaine reductase